MLRYTLLFDAGASSLGVLLALGPEYVYAGFVSESAINLGQSATSMEGVAPIWASIALVRRTIYLYGVVSRSQRFAFWLVDLARGHKILGI